MKNQEDTPRSNKKTKGKPTRSGSWVVRVFFLSVLISAALSVVSELVLDNANYWVAICVLLFFVALGILFDIVGVAVTSADARPFYSMASHRIKGAKEAIWLINNAEKVSSICNDVVGDICGIVSGATAAVIVVELQRSFNFRSLLVSTVVTALISGMTIGGKAAGKKLAIKRNVRVVYLTARVMTVLRIKRK